MWCQCEEFEASKAFWPSRSLGRWQGSVHYLKELWSYEEQVRGTYDFHGFSERFQGFLKVCSKVWLINSMEYRWFFNDDLLVIVCWSWKTPVVFGWNILLFGRTNRVDDQLNKQHHRISSTDRPIWEIRSWQGDDIGQIQGGCVVWQPFPVLQTTVMWNGFDFLEDCWVSWSAKGMVFDLIVLYRYYRYWWKNNSNIRYFNLHFLPGESLELASSSSLDFVWVAIR